MTPLRVQCSCQARRGSFRGRELGRQAGVGRSRRSRTTLRQARRPGPSGSAPQAPPRTGQERLSIQASWEPYQNCALPLPRFSEDGRNYRASLWGLGPTGDQEPRPCPNAERYAARHDSPMPYPTRRSTNGECRLVNFADGDDRVRPKETPLPPSLTCSRSGNQPLIVGGTARATQGEAA